MRCDRTPRVVGVIMIALFAVACSGAPDRLAPEAEEASGRPSPAREHVSLRGPDDHLAADAHADDEDAGDRGGHDGHGAAGEEPASVRPRTTEQTLAAIDAMDPARLTALHDHHNDGEAVGEAGSTHPNGIDPDRIVIPAIGVDADVIDLGLQADGAMEVPADFARAGWFTPGPRPGRVGPAVIAGHVDSRSGPAVFFRLAELRAGDLIEVHDPLGEVVTFAVRETEQHPKDAFPTEQVYAGTPGPELRLITCGGVFDDRERSYRDNLIVYAERVER